MMLKPLIPSSENAQAGRQAKGPGSGRNTGQLQLVNQNYGGG